jgi:hypothetical protein
MPANEAINSDSNVLIYQTPDGRARVTLYARDGSVWMNQQQLAELFDTSIPNISLHLKNIFEDKELEEDSVVKEYLTTAPDGKNYQVRFYSLAMILAIGFRVRSPRGRQFRQWANTTLHEYMHKGFVMDDERLKGGADYFDELLARIRDIRASEKRFYQKVRDLFALCSDYDASDKATQMFFAETQNKLLFAVTQHTAAEIITQRAKADAPNMGLTAWQGAVVRKGDIVIAKNYLSSDEIDTLNRLVVIFLETAELQAKNKQDLRMQFWRERVDRILTSNDFSVLSHAGKVSHAQMEAIAREIYAEFDSARKQRAAQAADADDAVELAALEQLEKEIKTNRR